MNPIISWNTPVIVVRSLALSGVYKFTKKTITCKHGTVNFNKEKKCSLFNVSNDTLLCENSDVYKLLHGFKSVSFDDFL